MREKRVPWPEKGAVEAAVGFFRAKFREEQWCRDLTERRPTFFYELGGRM
jgi:hypothetical protein